MAAYSIPGQLYAELTPLSSVDTSGNNIVNNITATVSEVVRDSNSLTSASFTYYIEAAYDINSKITIQHNDATDDDSWALEAFSILNTDASGVVLNLPSVSGLEVPAGILNIYATDTTTLLGHFDVKVTMGISSQGVTSAFASITGNSISTSENENTALAQVLYWSGFDDVPTVNANTADTLSKSISASDAETKYSSQLTAITNTYNSQNVIAMWEIAIDNILHAADSILAQHARFKNVTTSNVFTAGEKIVANSTYSYAVSVNDYLGTPIPVVVGDVYGVVKQT